MPTNQDTTITHEEIAALAYEYWQQRESTPGSAPGSAHSDWLRAEQDLLEVRHSSAIDPRYTLESEHPE